MKIAVESQIDKVTKEFYDNLINKYDDLCIDAMDNSTSNYN
jgi:hypothetical protein